MAIRTLYAEYRVHQKTHQRSKSRGEEKQNTHKQGRKQPTTQHPANKKNQNFKSTKYYI